MRTVSKRLIVVEEINEFIAREKSLLSREDFRLLTVTSGEEALFRARNDKPDLLILNFYMPDLNGYQVCRKLKDDSATQQIPVLIISTQGYDGDDPGRLADAAGCDGCIEKPIHHDDLVPAVEKLLGIPPRRHLRRKSSLACTITDEDGVRGGTILNLTPEGLFVETAPAPWPGDIVKAEISAEAAGASMTLQLAVRWSREAGEAGPGGGGCEFLSPSAEVLERLENHILSSPAKP